jgi:hypothetical protein
MLFDAEKIVARLLDKLLPNRAAPVLGRVLKAHEGPGKNTYSVDVRIVTAGTLEDTDQVIAEVPLSHVWTTKKGKGIYAIPPADTLVIVEFLQWNPAYPYVSGIWSNEYNAAQFKKDQLVITDGKDLRVEFSDDEILIHDSNGFQWQFVKGKLLVSDGTGVQFGVNAADLFIFETKAQSLKKILDKMIDETAAIKTRGPPPQHIVTPASQLKLKAIKNDVAALLQ